MLGLGLGVSKVSSLRSLAAKLLAKLKSRSTYYENNKDSKQVAQDLDTIDVLDKASILLTPTAYSDARVHSVKTYTGENALTGNSSTFDTGVGDWVGYGTGQVSHASTYLRVDVQTTEGGAQIPVNSLIQGGQVGKAIKVRVKLWVVSGESGLYPLFKVFLGGDQKDISLTPSPTYYDFLIKPTTTADLIIYKTNAAKSSGVFAIDDVSVVDVSSDFDFDRASSATRINSDGLVQDMQSITDPELVLNGDFEELGGELVTNGTFDTDSDWTKGTGWSIANGKASSDGSGGSNNLRQSNILTIGSTYKITITVSDYVSGNVEVSAGASPRGRMSANGTYTFYQEATPTDDFYIIANAFEGSIDNVSVQQVDPNEYWGTGGGWSLEQGAAVATSGSGTKLSQAGISSSGKVIKTTFTISNYGGSGSVFVDFGSSNSSAVSGNGTHTVIGTFDQDNFEILKSSDFEGKIDNISVKDITFSEDVDLARINYDSNGENGHWLLEPTSTNLLPYSEDFTTWTVSSGLTLTDNSIISPSGLNDGWKVESDGTSGFSALSYAVSISGDNTFSVYAKQGTNRYITLRSLSGVDARANFDLQEGTSTSSNATSIIEDAGNGWYRCSMSFTGTNANVYIYPNEIGTADSGYIYLQFAQLEALSYATSYIPTYGSTVTRATETLNGSGNSTLINSTEGVLYAEIAAFENTNTDKNISISDGTATNRIGVYYYGNTMSAVGYLGGANQFYLAKAITDVKEFIKVAVKYKENDFALWIDGEQIATDTSGTVPSGLNSLQFDNGGGIGDFYGNCKALALFDEALTDTELQNLTS